MNKRDSTFFIPLFFFVTYFACSRFWAYVKDLVAAVAYIDSRGAVHRDIKADNVLIDAAHNIKLADFGLAKKVVC